MAVLMLAGAAFPARAEWQMQAGLGASWTERSDLHVQTGGSDFTVDDVGWSGRSFEMPVWYDIRVTYFLPSEPSLGFTAGLMHAKVHAKTGEARRIHGTRDGVPIDVVEPLENTIQRFEISNGVNFLEFGVVGRLHWQVDEDFPNGRIRPYAVLAAGPVINHAENVIGGVANDPDYHQNDSWGTQAMLGVQYALTQDWSLYSEVKRTHVSVDVDVAEGRAQTDLDTTHAAFGIAYTF